MSSVREHLEMEDWLHDALTGWEGPFVLFCYEYQLNNRPFDKTFREEAFALICSYFPRLPFFPLLRVFDSFYRWTGLPRWDDLSNGLTLIVIPVGGTFPYDCSAL